MPIHVYVHIAVYIIDDKLCNLFLFFFKQKTAYEMRISDWSSVVCSSDLPVSNGHVHSIRWDEGRYVRDAWPLELCDTADPRKFLVYGGSWQVMALTKSEKRRGGQESVHTCRTRWAQIN